MADRSSKSKVVVLPVGTGKRLSRWLISRNEGRQLRRYSARASFLALIAAAVLPVWLFAALALLSFASSQQQTFRESAEALAQQVASILDEELADAVQRTEPLTRSSAPLSRDYAKARQAARSLIANTALTISVRDASRGC